MEELCKGCQPGASEVRVFFENCSLFVKNRAGEIVARAEFSGRHFDMVRNHHWSLSTGGYPRNIKHRRNLHQLIMGKAPKGKEIDHINGNQLDNRDENLRFVTHAQNGRNLKLSKRNKSGVRGVWYDPVNKGWMVKINYLGKQLFLGRHKSYEEAVRIRKGAEEKYYGEFTRAV